MRIGFALPGLHRIDRGAEIAFMSIADELALRGHDVTLFGSGTARAGKNYRFVHVGSMARENFENWPRMPMFRDETAYEELTFAVALSAKYAPGAFDVVAGCSYPFLNWMLRRPVFFGSRPKYVFVTQNGDHPATAGNREYVLFGCDGIVCINPDFHSNNKDRWNAALIPNGVNTVAFRNAIGDRKGLGLPENKKIALMVSALIASKRVDKAIEAVAQIHDLHLVVAGDGPERDKVAQLAAQYLPGRFTRLTLAPGDMPKLYHSADVFLHTSKAEAFGNVFIEALACGLPVVAHDIARHRWVIGETGYFADTEVAGNTAHAIRSALQSDGDVRKERAEWVNRYDWKLIADQYEAFFGSLTGGKKP